MEQDEGPSELRSSEPGERRRVTLLFSDICDYTSLNELIDPEETDLLRRQIEQAATDVIHKHGGAISQYYGDGILAVFGLPNPAEHDVRAALNSALELRASLRQLKVAIELPRGFELRMHFGVHCGLVFARGGDELHGRYDLTGDAVNTAARLCAAAARDQILASEAAMSGVEPFYEAEIVEALALKGKRLSVPAYRVHAHSGVRTRFEASARRGLTEFVNRDEELGRLASSLVEAAQRGTCTKAIAGGPGIGKTRVLEEFMRRQATKDVLIFRGTCESYGSVVPLQPLIQILRQALKLRAGGQLELSAQELRQRCASLGADVEPYAELLSTVLVPEVGVQRWAAAAVHRSLIEAICALVRSLRAGLVVLVIDDWQWVDDLTHQVVRGVVRAMERGVLVLLAAREHNSDDVLLDGAELIEVRPLRAGDSTRVIHSLLPDTLDLGLTERLHRRSGGNPLFLEELCRALPHELPRGTDLEPSAVPQTVHGVIQGRLATLPERELQVLRTASAVGNDFAVGLLTDVTGYDDVERVLERLAANDLVRPSEDAGAYRFKHGITREVVYESVLLAERKRIHAALAEHLVRRAAEGGTAEPLEALAHHHVHSGQHARAAHYAELAGDRATATAALDRARVQYGTALTELDRLPMDVDVKRRWLAVSVKWARAWVYSQAPEQLVVLDRAKRHAEELGDLNLSSDLDQMSAWICYALGEQERAIEYGRTGLALAERVGNVKLIAQLKSNLGQSHAAAGEPAQAIELLTQSMELKREGARGRTGSVPVGFAFASVSLATVHADQGEIAQARIEMAQALDAVRGSGNPIEASMLALAAMTELWRGEWGECVATCARATMTAERIQGPYVFTISQAMSSFCRFMLQRHPEDRERLCKAADWLEARGMGLYLSMVYGCAARANWLAADAERARDYAGRALARAEHKDPFGEAIAYRVLAGLCAREHGSPNAETWTLMDRATAAAQRRGSRPELAFNDRWRAKLWQLAGDSAASGAAFESSLGQFETLGLTAYAEIVKREMRGESI